MTSLQKILKNIKKLTYSILKICILGQILKSTIDNLLIIPPNSHQLSNVFPLNAIKNYPLVFPEKKNLPKSVAPITTETKIATGTHGFNQSGVASHISRNKSGSSGGLVFLSTGLSLQIDERMFIIYTLSSSKHSQWYLPLSSPNNRLRHTYTLL